MIVDRALYVGGRRVASDLPLREAVERAQEDPSAFVWIGLHEPTDDEFAEVREVFGLHPLAVEDAIHAHQRPKVERYGDSLFVVLKPAEYVDRVEAVRLGEIMLFLGADFVVTVRHGEASGLAAVRRMLESDPEQLRHGPMSVLHAVADRVVDEYAAVLDGLDTDVLEIEADVFTPGRHNHAERIYRLKREVQQFRWAVAPLREAIEQLLQGRSFRVADDLRDYFRDVHDHAVRATQHILTLDELLDSALSANLAQIGVQQNEDMRRISAWVAIAAAPTAIAGIYGMNFEYMPELDERYAYFVVLGVIATVCVGLFALFKRSGWL